MSDATPAEPDPSEVAGMLLREAGGFVLVADDGTRLRLELARVPVDLVGKRACVSGVHAAAGLFAADGVRPG